MSATTTTTTTTTIEEGSGGSPAFAFDFVGAGDCGLTCRSVTTKLTNTGTAPAIGAVVTVTLFADGQRIWRGTQDVGRLDPGQSYTGTRDVDVGVGGALAIQNSGGTVDVRVVISHAGGEAVFEDTLQVG